MKIFQIITVSEYGGAQSIVANLIKSLNPSHKVFVLYGGEGEAWSTLGDGFTRVKLNGHRKSVSLSDIGLFFRLLYCRFKYNPDVVHLHSSKMGALGRMAFSKKKTIYTVHGFDSVRVNFREFLIIEKLLKNKVSKIVGVSEYDVQGLKAEQITKNVCCIYNGVPDYLNIDAEYDSRMKDRLEDIKKKYPRIVMCIARITRQKRFDLFLEIASALPEYAFVWIGNKKEMPDVPENVFCLGETNSAQMYLRFADIFVLPSNYEGLPMSLLEAMSFGKPIVASAVGGIPEVLNSGNGFAVENDCAQFAEKIEYVFSDESVYEEISKQSRKRYLENHTIEKMIDEYLTLYKSLEKK